MAKKTNKKDAQAVELAAGLYKFEHFTITLGYTVDNGYTIIDITTDNKCLLAATVAKNKIRVL